MHADLQPLGRMLMVVGIFFLLAGLVAQVGHKLPWLGRLPGDIAIRRDGFSFYFPLTTCLLASVLISVVVWALGRFRQ
jgi:hypothetical protein